MELFKLEPGLMIWSLMTFVILLALLSKFAFPPILEQLKKREETIRGSLEEADKTRVEAGRLLDEYKQQMAEASKEAQKIIGQARTVGENMKAELQAKAHEEAEQMIEQARKQIAYDTDKALAEVRQEVATMSVDIASKVIGRALKPEDHQALIEKEIAEVDRLQ